MPALSTRYARVSFPAPQWFAFMEHPRYRGSVHGQHALRSNPSQKGDQAGVNQSHDVDIPKSINCDQEDSP